MFEADGRRGDWFSGNGAQAAPIGDGLRTRCGPGGRTAGEPTYRHRGATARGCWARRFNLRGGQRPGLAGSSHVESPRDEEESACRR
jgi:hypothetical protein